MNLSNINISSLLYENCISHNRKELLMSIIVVFLTTCLTIGFLNNSKIDKSPTQLMLLGIELTIIGALFIFISIFTKTNLLLYLAGLVCFVIGLIFNLYGFSKK